MKRYEFKVVVDLFDTSDPQKVANYLQNVQLETNEVLYSESQTQESLVSVDYQEVPLS